MSDININLSAVPGQPQRENERLYRTEAIVLKSMNIGEADKILTIYTPRLGKLRVVAKAVRRPTSRMSGYVESFTQSKMLVARGRNLDIVTQSEPINLFRRVRDDLHLFAFASYFVELLDRLTEDNSENFPAYQLLADALDAINAGDDPETTARAYELHLLDLMGYRPQLQQCVRCATELKPEINYFSPEMGGGLCPNCGQVERRSVEISVNALRMLRHYQRNAFGTAQQVRLPTQLRQEMEHVLRSYTRYLLERDLKSTDFLHSLD